MRSMSLPWMCPSNGVQEQAATRSKSTVHRIDGFQSRTSNAKTRTKKEKQHLSQNALQNRTSFLLGSTGGSSELPSVSLLLCAHSVPLG